MYGQVAWWSRAKSHGIIEVVKDGICERYFVLLSHILRSPATIQAGQYAKFEQFAGSVKPGLLPLAVSVVLQNEPFTDSAPESVKEGAK